MIYVKCVTVQNCLGNAYWVSHVALVIRNTRAGAGGVRDSGLDRWVRRMPWRGHGNPSSILAWRIPWTEEAAGLWSIGSQRDTTEATEHACNDD